MKRVSIYLKLLLVLLGSAFQKSLRVDKCGRS